MPDTPRENVRLPTEIAQWLSTITEHIGYSGLTLTAEEQQLLLGKLSTFYERTYIPEKKRAEDAGEIYRVDAILIADAIREHIQGSQKKRDKWFKKMSIFRTLENHQSQKIAESSEDRKKLAYAKEVPTPPTESSLGGDRFSMVRLIHIQHLIHETKVLDHCVGKQGSISSYMRGIISGEKKIFSIRAEEDLTVKLADGSTRKIKKGDPVVTIEYLPKKRLFHKYTGTKIILSREMTLGVSTS